MIDKKHATETMAMLEKLIVAIRATGGYKYRAFVHMPEEELDRFVAGAMPTLRGMALRLIAAEDVIERYGHGYDYKLTMGDVARAVEAKEVAPPVRPPVVRQPPSRAERRRLARVRGVVG